MVEAAIYLISGAILLVFADHIVQFIYGKQVLSAPAASTDIA